MAWTRQVALLVVGAAVGVAVWLRAPSVDEPSAVAQPQPTAPITEVGAAVSNEPPAEQPGTRAALVRVRVIGVDGRPLRGATVRAVEQGFHYSFTIAQEVAGDDGWASLRVDREDPSYLVSLPFFGSAFGRFKDGEVVTLKPLPAARGTVRLADGSLAARARVVASYPEGYETLTGPDGRFELRLPYPAQLVAELNGQVGVGRGDAEALERGNTEITLRAPLTYRGKVVDGQRAPLKDVTVELVNAVLTTRTSTAGDGTWSGAYFPSPHTEVSFHKPGFLSGAMTLPIGFADGPLVLHRPASVVGTLRDAQGKPVAGAAVQLQGRASASASTGAAGEFTFSNVMPEANVTVTATLGEDAAQRTVELADGQSVTVELVLPPSPEGEVEVEVVDEEGEPRLSWRGVAVPVPAQGWEVPFSSEQPLRVRRGRFHLQVEDSFEGALRSELEAELDPRVDAAPLRLVLREVPSGSKASDEPQKTIHVVVRGPSGVSVGQAEVYCGDSPVVTREDGTCECPLSRSQSGAVVVSAHWRELSDSRTVPATETSVELRLAAPQEVTVTVVGTLPPKASLTVNSATQMDEFVLPGTTFSFHANSTPACVCVNSRGGDPAGRLGCAVLGAGERAVTVPVGTVGTAQLHLEDDHGQPLEQPILYVDRERMAPFAVSGLVTLTLSPGSHMLVVNAAGTSARAQTVITVRSGERTEVPTLRLQ